MPPVTSRSPSISPRIVTVAAATRAAPSTLPPTIALTGDGGQTAVDRAAGGEVSRAGQDVSRYVAEDAGPPAGDVEVTFDRLFLGDGRRRRQRRTRSPEQSPGVRR